MVWIYKPNIASVLFNIKIDKSENTDRSKNNPKKKDWFNHFWMDPVDENSNNICKVFTLKH